MLLLQRSMISHATGSTLLRAEAVLWLSRLWFLNLINIAA
jgi:hypothetical protein